MAIITITVATTYLLRANQFITVQNWDKKIRAISFGNTQTKTEPCNNEIAIEKCKAGLHPSKSFLSIKISPAARGTGSKAGCLLPHPLGRAFPEGTPTSQLSSLEMAALLVTFAMLEKNLLFFCQDLPLHFL